MVTNLIQRLLLKLGSHTVASSFFFFFSSSLTCHSIEVSLFKSPVIFVTALICLGLQSFVMMICFYISSPSIFTTVLISQGAVGFLCMAVCIAELFFQYCILWFNTLLFQIPQHNHHYQHPVWMGLDHSKMLISFRQLYSVLPALSLTVRTSKCYYLALAPFQIFRFQFWLLKIHSNRNGCVE